MYVRLTIIIQPNIILQIKVCEKMDTIKDFRTWIFLLFQITNGAEVEI